MENPEVESDSPHLVYSHRHFENSRYELEKLLNISNGGYDPDITVTFAARGGEDGGRMRLLANSVIIVFYSVIIIVSLSGNLLVCRALMRQRRLCSNSTNTLIGVLAISDLMMTTFNIPFTVVDIILKDWIFGPFFCTVVSFVQANSVYVSSFTMAVIAMNRWKQIYHFKPNVASKCPAPKKRALVTLDPSEVQRSNCLSCVCCKWPRHTHHHQSANHSPPSTSATTLELENVAQSTSPPPRLSTKKLNSNFRLLLIILAIWGLAAVHSLPHTIFNRVKTIYVLRSVQVETLSDVAIVKRCVPVLPKLFDGHFNLILTLYTSLTQYFIPLSCAGIIYTRIGFTIMAQGKVGELSRIKAERLSQRKRRRLLMLVMLVAIFALCWLPFNVYYLLLDFGVTKSTNYGAFLICHWLAMSSVCYNPFIYCWLNEHFQSEFKQVYQRLRMCFQFK